MLDLRDLIPNMARVAARYRLNLLAAEALVAAEVLGADIVVGQDTPTGEVCKEKLIDATSAGAGSSSQVRAVTQSRAGKVPYVSLALLSYTRGSGPRSSSGLMHDALTPPPPRGGRVRGITYLWRPDLSRRGCSGRRRRPGPRR